MSGSSEYRVVVSGVGTVGAHGTNLEALRRSLEGGLPVLTAVDRSEGFHRKTCATSAIRLKDGALHGLLSPRLARRMSPASRMAVAAAHLAVASAGCDAGSVAGSRTSVVLGTAFGTPDFTQRLLQQIRDTGPQSASPFYFMETVASAHAGQIALSLSVTGPNFTVSHREASGMLAVCKGVELIEAGLADRVLAGSVDEVTPLQHAILDAWGALARPRRSGAGLARPFDRRRSGFLVGEGSTVLLLERADIAVSRGAPVLARVAATAKGNDPTAPRASWGTAGLRLGESFARRLASRGTPVESLGRVVSGASGAIAGDLAEGAFLRGLFAGGRVPDVLAPKAVTGEYGGAFLAAALLAMKDPDWGTARWFQEADPAIGVAPTGRPTRKFPGRLLVTTLAAGGAAVGLVLDRP